MDELTLLKSKLCDMIDRVDSRGCLSTRFLTPLECYNAKKYLDYSHTGVKYYVDGGYKDAERTKIVILADYMEPEYVDKSELYSLVRITGSGYNTLTHRDYMGAILGLGISREFVGDIIAQNNSAYVFVENETAQFLTSDDKPLEFVGRDKIRIESISLDNAIGFERKYEKIDLQVASMRIDCVTAAITNMSREKAADAVNSARVSLNYQTELSVSDTVKDMDVISITGFGKFIIKETGSTTKKGRLKICAMKYI